MRSRYRIALPLAVCVAVGLFAPLPDTMAAPQASPPAEKRARLLIVVRDENGVAVSSARVQLKARDTSGVSKGLTDFSGRFEFENLSPGSYAQHVEKEGFYPLDVAEVQVGETETLEVTLNHVQEFRETVMVTDSPPAIDPAQTASAESLNTMDIINVPYPATRDFRNALPMMPGVLQDTLGEAHIAGGATHQTFATLDGFNVGNPVNGFLRLHVSTDSLRSVEIQQSRSSAEFGEGSGGVVALNTGMGDDHFRFSATDFIPSFQSTKGIHVDSFTPRATLSGPLRKGKAWFYEAADGEYSLNIFSDLPNGADRSTLWRASNVGKVQINLPGNHRLMLISAVSSLRSSHEGLSRFQPMESTVDLRRAALLAAAKDQVYLSNGMLVEVGFGFSQFHSEILPLGTLPYQIHPDAVSGSFYRTSDGRARRYEGIVRLDLPTRSWRGRHMWKIGANLQRITYEQNITRLPFSIFRADGTLSRAVSFVAPPGYSKNDFRLGVFLQDRWSLNDRFLLEPGVRFDWYGVVHRQMAAPRLAASYLLTPAGNTKLSLGAGLYYDVPFLEILTRAQAGTRQDIFYAPDGVTPLGPPVATSFAANDHALRPSRVLNWSIGLEHKLPASVYLEIQFLQKRGAHGWEYETSAPACNPAPLPCGSMVLRDAQRDHYDAVSISLRRAFKQNYRLFASYTRSSARSNSVLDSDQDTLLFGTQSGGPLPWDAPNRFLSWGWLPLIRGFDLAYSTDWRTGYPYSLVNENQQLVGLPNRTRFPDYFVLNVHVEKRFRLVGFQWAIRGGFNNLTNRDNPAYVDNNVNSQFFGSFSGIQHRAFTGRIRFLGRK